MLPAHFQRLAVREDSAVLAECSRLVRDVTGWRSLYLWGANGVGKSCAAAVIYCRWSLGRAIFRTANELFSDAMTLEREKEITRYIGGVACEITHSSFWRSIEECGLLVLDEIAQGDPHEWRSEMFWRVLEARKRKPLIMTGNVSPDVLVQAYDQRIASRIQEGSFLKIVGSDGRKAGLTQRFSIVQRTV